jgi:Flp pilus assembly pilin Flp
MLKNVLKKLYADERGLETVEYAIIVGLIVAGTITAVTAIGGWVSGQFGGLQTTLGA